MMSEVIINVKTVPELLYQRFNSEKVRVQEENGAVILTPVQELNEDFWSALDRLRSKISDGRLSTENYVAQKQIDKELEG